MNAIGQFIENVGPIIAIIAFACWASYDAGRRRVNEQHTDAEQEEKYKLRQQARWDEDELDAEDEAERLG